MTQTFFERLNQAFPGAQLQFLMSGYWIPQAIGVAADLGIADLLSEGPKTSDELAIATGNAGPLRAYASTRKRRHFH
jgi:hypothetical protein